MIVILLYLRQIRLDMDRLSIKIAVNPELYNKNPDSSELGKRIVSKSIEMIEEMGFEVFTFKKLGVAIGSNESSIYRYFDSKHALLLFLFNWYWRWTEYRLVLTTQALDEPEDKLRLAIKLLTREITQDNAVSYINEVLLHRIIVAESSKAYHTKKVDEENAQGFFLSYKQVVQRLADMVLAINPTFPFPHMLISTVIEGAHHQRYFSEHLPALTDVEPEQNNIVNFYTELVFKTIS